MGSCPDTDIDQNNKEIMWGVKPSSTFRAEIQLHCIDHFIFNYDNH